MGVIWFTEQRCQRHTPEWSGARINLVAKVNQIGKSTVESISPMDYAGGGDKDICSFAMNKIISYIV